MSALATVKRGRGMRFRFSVRTLIFIVLVIGCVLGWGVRVVRRAQVQRYAVETIRIAGGGVYYDWELQGGEIVWDRKPNVPRWLVGILGVDYFGHVTKADMGSRGDDAILVQVGKLSQLEELSVSGPSVTDDGLAHIEGLTQLRELARRGTAVSDRGLRHLRRMTQLERLDIEPPTIGDLGLGYLSGLTHLGALNLDGSRVTDAGLAHLRGMTKLTILSLANTQITDAGLAHLKNLRSLRMLVVEDTNVSDKGVGDLRRTLPTAGIHR